MSTFSKLSFKTKLIGLCLFLCGISVTIGTIGLLGLSRVSDVYSQITSKVMPKLEHANEMFVSYRAIRINLRTLGLPGITPEQEAHAVEKTKEAIAAFEEAEKNYLALGFVDGQKPLYDELHESWKLFKGVGTRVLALQKSGSPADHQEIVHIFFNDCPNAAKEFTEDMEALLKFHKEAAFHRSAEAEAIGRNANNLMLLVALLGSLSGLTLGVLFSSSISKTINQIAQTLSTNATGVASASTQVAASSGSLSEASTEQAAALEQTATALEEISAMIAKATESAGSTAASSKASQEKAEEGRAAVSKMMDSMNDISQSNNAVVEQMSSSTAQMTEIVRVIQEIGNKTKVINEIVFQTKLLSFNASVEAARAGEHGKGFSVVAEEVGNLAQMSGNAAKEISEMLGQSIANVERIVTESKTKVEALVTEGRQKVESGIEVATQCSDVLNDIVANVTKVSELAESISQASQQQAQGVAEINKAMSQLDTVTQQNAATSEEAASAARDLSTQAESMKHSVEQLQATMQGAGHMPAAPIAPTSTSSDTKVVALKPKAAAPKVAAPTKVASGDGFVPSRDDAGFAD